MIDFSKNINGLVPAIIQDIKTKNVLMLGYMNEEAYNKTKETLKVTFYSRTKQRLWTKGEESGNFLQVQNIMIDCDNDTLLIFVKPLGPTCHTGNDTCWGKNNLMEYGFLTTLENIIIERRESINNTSYVASLFQKGINKIAQKVGEEAVETIIEAKDNNDELFINEAADLLFHYLILLQAKNFSIQDVITILEERHNRSKE